MAQPIDIEDADHPEAERELAFRLPPRTVTAATVQFRQVGRPKPRLVLDDVVADDE